MSKTTTKPRKKSNMAAKMPAGERAKLSPDDELNQQQAGYFLGIGRTTLGALLALGEKSPIKHKRYSERNYRIRVADLLAYEAAVTVGGPTETTTGARKK